MPLSPALERQTLVLKLVVLSGETMESFGESSWIDESLEDKLPLSGSSFALDFFGPS